MGKQRKVRLNRQKKFISPKSTTTHGNEEIFCKPTAESIDEKILQKLSARL
ncbi:MAG: hypothetical protein IJR52_08665 [Selenomonadaceae bacterium]|nr:hypothetical protein [Selenomonadaceae bacterium]